jgi:hypothetical protein
MPKITKLRKQNLAHHNTVPNRLSNKQKIASAMKSRAKYLEKLSTKPYFGALLKNRRTIPVMIKGKSVKYTFLKTGIKKARLYRKGMRRKVIVNRDLMFVLDPLGRLRTFSKEPIEKHGMATGEEFWVELRGFSTNNVPKESIECNQRATHPADVPERDALNIVLSRFEFEADFKEWSSRKIPYFLKYL